MKLRTYYFFGGTLLFLSLWHSSPGAKWKAFCEESPHKKTSPFLAMCLSWSTAGILLLTDMFLLSCRYFCRFDAQILPEISRKNFSSDDSQRSSCSHAQSNLYCAWMLSFSWGPIVLQCFEYVRNHFQPPFTKSVFAFEPWLMWLCYVAVFKRKKFQEWMNWYNCYDINNQDKSQHE